MLEEEFYTRLILNIIVGIMFAYALVKMAQHNNQEITPERHTIMKVFGWIFVGLSGVIFIQCLVLLLKVDFPTSVSESFVSPDMIVRPSSSSLYWGYPTETQNSILSSESVMFALLGIGGYFLYFMSSDSRWWKKILKFFAILLLFVFMNSSTNFHYFDLWEFVAPVLFIILWYVIINRCSRSAKKAPYTHDRKTPSSEEEEQAANKDSITEKGELLRPSPAHQFRFKE